MVWQIKVVIGMAEEWCFQNNYCKIIIVFLFSNCIYSQDIIDDEQKESNWSFYTEYMNLYSYSELLNQTDYKTTGIDAAVLYYVGKSIGFHIGSGYEYIDAIDTHYSPLYVGLNLQFRKINSVYTRVSFGTHLGEFDKGGFMFRWGLGFQFKIFKSTQAYIGFLYSFQNIYKTVESLDKDYFNIKSAGFSIGFKFN